MEFIFIFGIFLALLFCFINGVNDAGNSIATIVATRALKPLYALILAAVCNFAGPFVLTTAIAKTIGTGLIIPGILTPDVLVIALVSVVIILVLLTLRGFPVSASHALIGSMTGSSVAAAGISVIIWPGIDVILTVLLAGTIGALCGSLYLSFLFWVLKGQIKYGALSGAIGGFSLSIIVLMTLGYVKISGILSIFLFIVISPTIGFLSAYLLDVVVSYIFRHSRQSTRNRIFFPLQVVTGGLQAMGHGANDGMHAVGVIVALFIAGGLQIGFDAPTWIILAAAIAIGTGTIFGGWNVITKMAIGITRIRPYQGFCASTAGGLVISSLTLAGIPTSSTHIISGTIVGVGATRGIKAVDWSIVRGIVTTWIVTFPFAFFLSALLFLAFGSVSAFYSMFLTFV
ncbi:MAG: inorganic phosphate transporter [Methanomicrobiales archaeon]|nr:inorganic phosphate transporter [Methanomicrobiales archaeon]